MRAFLALAASLGALAGCEPSPCDDVAPPYSFEVTLAWFGAAPGLTVELATDVQTDRFVMPWEGASYRMPHMTAMGFEWGGSLPDRSVGTFSAYAVGRAPVELTLAAEEDEYGCPLTVRDAATLSIPGR